MDIYSLDRSRLLSALRAASVDYPHLSDGTYRLIPGWIGNTRTWSAELVSETDGYEVALAPAVGDWDHSELQWGGAHARYGVWTSPTGAVCIDRTVHVRGTVNDALNIGAHYSQEAIWDWSAMASIPVITYPTAVDSI